jgi:type II secretory pathway pseudopilin PulG
MDTAAIPLQRPCAEGSLIVHLSKPKFSPPPGSPAAATRRAMTLMELLIGLAITAMVAGVIAVLMNSTAMGTNTQQDGRRSLVKFQQIKALVGDKLANARCILDASLTGSTGPYYIVYWTGDPAPNLPSNGSQSSADVQQPSGLNGSVDLSELCMLEVDTTTGNLNLWSTSNGCTNDQTYSASSSWRSAAVAAKSNSSFVPTLLATGVTSMVCSLDAGTMTQAKLIHTVITFTDSAGTKQVVASAVLQNQKAPQ